MSEDNNRRPQPPKLVHIDQEDARELKSAQTLVIAASVMGPISMLIGGVILSTVALVCGVLALVRLRRLKAKGGATGLLASRLLIACVVALTVTAIAFVLNAIAFATLYPLVLEAVQTGDYSKILPEGSLPAGTDTGGTGGTSTWG